MPLYTNEVTITLTEWTKNEMAKIPQIYTTLEDRVKLVIRLSQKNIDHQTGGPFAAAVFEKTSGKLVSIGVNRVTSLNCSSVHAEIVALSMAQKELGKFDLGGPGLPGHQLVVNWRPCIMCFGAVIWSGVRSLVIGGSGPEMEELTGFDEGPMNENWVEELEKRGIEVIPNFLPDEAIKVFHNFKERGMLVYNSRQGK
ncbi:nucleoside deaminase [Candidatus Bathyarchaeota archaeon]|nr:MAG: nucleoside deaminase [Candidatus Bathyarchaeota archaeon]